MQDYRLHLIDPARLTAEQLGKFSTSLREVLGYIKYSRSKDELSEFLTDNPRMVMEASAARVIKVVTNTPIRIPEGEATVDMCKAVEEMMTEREARGEMTGKKEMARSLAEMGVSADKIAQAAKVSIELVQEWLSGKASPAQ